MTYLTHILLGFVMAFISLIPPGMLNMTAVRTTIEKNKKEGVWFSLGAALVVIPQAFIALVFARFFADHPEIIDRLNLAGIIVLFFLSVMFFIQARKKFRGEGGKRRGKSFWLGILMSGMNMLAIPFYLVLSSVLEHRGLLNTEQPFINLFVTGVFLGAFTLFFTYVNFARIVVKRAQFIARNINYILSLLFFFLGILTLIRFL
ncbi:LysE family transporter [Lutimonas saemankumensis]|uniref:LysE family translocator n=1 Tax=Lutimonas saemankumensis TaxID=483016 RepID=UPI001CD3AA5D|nr:LysE family transporter [Lutimonas saemankumensis]MCA0932336.1 LysE family transporter [Lutimonas saemankumensis]